jgi:hypothetical protein
MDNENVVIKLVILIKPLKLKKEEEIDTCIFT